MKIPTRVRWFASGDAHSQRNWPDWLLDRWPDRLLQKGLCLLGGHAPIADQCNRPEHDHCAWCHESMPNQATREETE